MRRLTIQLKPEDPSSGLKTSSREDGSSMLESKDHSRIRLERVKSDQRFLSSEIRVTLILKHLLIPFLKKKQTRKPHSSKESKIKKKLMPRS